MYGFVPNFKAKTYHFWMLDADIFSFVFIISIRRETRKKTEPRPNLELE